MFVPLFAMPSPQVLLLLPIGFVFVLPIAGLFVTASRTPEKRREQDRRAGLGLAAIVSGPLVGASLAFLANALGNVHPADVGYTYTVFTVIGGIAGLLGGVAFGMTCLAFSPRFRRESRTTQAPGCHG